MTKEFNNTSEPLSLHYFINLFRKNWIIFSISLIITTACAFFINKIKEPVWEVKTSVVVNQKNNNLNQVASIFNDIGILSSDKNFANEMLVLGSTPLINDAVSKLDLQVSYYYKTFFTKAELYKNSPFIVVINPNHVQPVGHEIFIEILNEKEFHITTEGNNVWLYDYKSNQYTQVLNEFVVNGIGNFNQPISNQYYSFKIILNEQFEPSDFPTTHFSFVLNTPQSLVNSFKNQMQISPPDIESTVAQIDIRSSVPDKTIDFLNSLTDSYLNRDLTRKNHTSIKTIEYIDYQLNLVKDSLEIAEDRLQEFRSSRKVVDISLQTGQVFAQLRDLEREKAELMVKDKYYQYIDNYLKKNEEYSDLITPATMGITDPLLNNMIEELIKLNSEKVSLMKNEQQKSPYLKKIDIRIDNIRNMITENINYIKNTSDISLRDIDSRINQLNNEIRKLPETERELLGIKRKFDLNDEIYTYLLQKRSEAEIARASSLSDAEILEPAEITGSRVSPKTGVNYVSGIVLGILLPLIILRFKEINRKNVDNAAEVKRITNLPLLGEIYLNDKKTENVILDFPKSHITESFRKTKISLKYFLPEGESKIIVLTSSISQEGKSFISLNLSILLASSGLKTILVGFDLRRPKLYEQLELSDGIGLSSYLSNQCNPDDIIQKTKINNLDAIYAGDVPPNPGELVSSKKTDELLTILKQNYEYIVIDTAPVGLISDTYLLLDKADLKVIVTRLKHTPKHELAQIADELKSRDLKNLCLLINEIPLRKKTKYGYGYYEETKA